MVQPQIFYENNDLKGTYQYITIKDFVDRFVFETLDEDSYLKHTKRTKILKHAKEGLLELNKNVFNEPKIIEITVPENLSLPLPHDYVSFLRMSLVIKDERTDSFRLVPLKKNNNINTAVGYLQDHKARILFDHEGRVLTADAHNGYNIPYKKYEFVCGGDYKQIAKYGEFVIDESNKREMLFSSDLYDKEVVLEYLTDGLQGDKFGEDPIRVHKNMIEVLSDYVYYSLIKYRRNVPMNEKQRALMRFKTTRHEARLGRSDFSFLNQ